MEQNGIEKKCSARQSIMLLKHEHTNTTPNTLPFKCTREPPEEINVFSDGSWLCPTKRFLSLGGAGVWWPGRSIKEDYNKDTLKYIPLTHDEYEMAEWRQEPEGLTLFTKIGGYTGSSTRTELAAGILAISAHGPIHLASDSQAFVKAANKLI